MLRPRLRRAGQATPLQSYGHALLAMKREAGRLLTVAHHGAVGRKAGRIHVNF